MCALCMRVFVRVRVREREREGVHVSAYVSVRACESVSKLVHLLCARSVCMHT